MPPSRRYARQASVVIVKPAGTGTPSCVISARPIPLPPSSSLPPSDGSSKSFPGPVTVAEIAAAIGAGLARAALAGKLDGKLVDTSYRVEKDAQLQIITERDAEGVDILRHSTAHLLAQAVKELFPDAQVTIGPVIENGFYYDFAYKRPFTPEDLAAIEKRMAELAAKDEPVTRRVLPRDEAVAHFKQMGEHYKAEIIGSIPAGEDVSLYREGGFEDLCRGPHVPSTGKLKAFKLMKVAGAYWRGDSRNEMLQRIYGTAWLNDKDLKDYLHRLEEAEKRDHRRIGRELDLFHFQEEAPGAVFWHPKGWKVFQQLIAYMRKRQDEAGYGEVNAPEIMESSLWQKSGHLEKFGENMFLTQTPDERVFAINDAFTRGVVADDVREALLQWEPRIEVLNVTVTAAGAADEILNISIDYRVRSTDNRFNLVYPYYLDRSAV